MRLRRSLGFPLAVLLVLGGCTHGGAKAPSPSTSTNSGTGTGTGSGTSAAASGSYANPAWNLPVAAPSTLWTQDQVPPTTFAGWLIQRPFLLDLSLWAEHVVNGSLPGRGALGAYGLGNGRVFTLEGLGYPLNTMHGAIGPSYQLGGDGFFGDVAVGLEIAPAQVAFAEEWVWKVRESAILVTKSDSPSVELWTVDFAPPGVDAIFRIVTVRNKTAAALPDATVLVRLAGGTSAENGRLVQWRDDRKLTIGVAPGTCAVSGGSGPLLRYDLGPLAAGAEATGLVYLAISRRAQNPAAEQAAIAACEAPGAADSFLDATRRRWATFFSQGARFEIPDRKVQDWIDDMVITDAVQTAENGMPSPMSRYTSTWMRDTEGPLRLYLRSGRHAEARAMMDGYYKTSILENGIHNSMSLDHDFAAVPPPPNWMSADFMPGRNQVEAPSFIVLNNWEYYRATGDLALLRDQYDFMKAAVLRQERSPDQLMKFNGDEAFRWVLAAALGLYEPENRGWSSNSAFLFVAAAERLAAIATLLGNGADAAQLFALAAQVRAATEAHFWMPPGYYDVCQLFFASVNVNHPFEDISLVPLRAGYGGPHDPHARQNFLYVKNAIGHGDGSIQSTFLTGIAAFDGMVPGYYLANLTIVDHPDGEKALNHLQDVARPSGEVCEGQMAGSCEAAVIQYHDDGGPDVVARFRPWEGSICADSLLGWVLGTDPDAASGRLAITPHMPNGWGSFAARDLRFLGAPVDVEVRDFGTRRLLRVTNRGAYPLALDLGLSVVGQAFGQLFVDGVPTALPAVDADFGRIAIRVPASVGPGQSVDVDATYVP